MNQMKTKYNLIVVILGLLLSPLTISSQCNAPIIYSFVPNTGFIGSTVTIFGANFDGTNPQNNIVYFGATMAQVQSASFGTLVVTVPVGASTHPISVTVDGCSLTAYSDVQFNGIFCPTPLDNQTYQNIAQDLPVTYGAYNMIAFDMDLDGNPEVVSQGFSTGTSIAQNNSTPGNLSFVTVINRSDLRSRGVFAADFDGDGLKDILLTDQVVRNTSTLGNVSIGPAITIPDISTYQVAAGDFNNDGKIDIAGGHWNGDVYVAFNTSTGPGNISFGPRQFLANTGSNCTGFQVGDLDEDGKTDIISSQGPVDRTVTLRNITTSGSSTANFETPEYWPSNARYPYRGLVADFDKDGKLDFTSANFSTLSGDSSPKTSVWRNISVVGDIILDNAINLDSPVSNYRIGVGDVDGDGYADIVTKSSGSNVFSVYRNTSSGGGTLTFDPRIDYTSSAQGEVSGIVIGDLDGDFVPDIATSGTQSNSIRFHRNTSAQVDTDPPTALCQDVTLALDPSGNATLDLSDIDNGSSDACGLDPLTVSQSMFTCSDIGDNTVTLFVQDVAGNMAQCNATVNVAPAAVIVTGQTTVCEGESVAMSANQGDSYQWKKDGVDIPGATSQNFTATESGDYSVEVINAGGCSGVSDPVTVVVNDNPTVDVQPAGVGYLCPPTFTEVLTASQSSIYQWQLNGTDISGATQQTYAATAVGSYTVEVIDLFGCSAVSDPVVVSFNNAEMEVTGNGISIADGDLVPDIPDGTDADQVLPNTPIIQSFVIENIGGGDDLIITGASLSGPDAANWTVVGTTFPQIIPAGGSINLPLQFQGAAIQTYNSTLTIENNDCDEGDYDFALAAEISCVGGLFTDVPNAIAVNTDQGQCSAVINYNVTYTGNPAPDVTYTFSGATNASGNGDGSGSTFNVGTTTVTVLLANPCSLNSSSFDVVVTDNEAPSILCPADVNTTTNAGSCEATGVILGFPLPTDNCAVTNLTFSPMEPYQLGETIVTWTATDAAGNFNNCEQTVTVEDKEPPSLICPANITVNTASGICETTLSNYTNSATYSDNCSIGDNFMQISAGDWFSTGLKSDGTIWSWGDNSQGQLGLSDNLDRNVINQIGVDTDWKQIDAGDFHTLALKTDGTLWAWGFNGEASLGDGTNVSTNTPNQIGTDSDWNAVAASGFHSMAIKNDGSLWVWGYNNFGQLGLGDNLDKLVPTQLGTDTDWVRMEPGGNHTILQKQDGSIWGCGRNAFGGLGLGDNLDRNTLQQIGTDTDWSEIEAGYNHTLVIKNNGTLWSWGHNSIGMLGQGDFVDRNIPTQVGNDTDWEEVESGAQHVMAIKTNELLYGWGSNNNGQLANGSNATLTSPAVVATDGN